MTEDALAFIDGMTMNLCNQHGIQRDTAQDILQEVRLAFLKSGYVDRYDPGRGPLKHYLKPRVRGAVTDAIRTSMGRDRSTNCPIKDFRRNGQRKIRPCDVLSYNVNRPSEEVNYALAYDEGTLDKLVVHDLLDKVLPELPPLSKGLLQLHYLLYDLTQAELGKLRGVTESRISQLMQRARREARSVFSWKLGIKGLNECN